MAENLKTLKQRIKTSKNISQISKAMEMISAAKIKKARKAVEANRPYADRITSALSSAIGGIKLFDFDSPYVKPSKSPKKLVIVVSPDKGLCGGLVSNIVRKLTTCDRNFHPLIVIGKKLERPAARMLYDIRASFVFGKSLPDYRMVFPVLTMAKQAYLSGDVSEISVLYSKYYSPMKQVPVIEKILPLDLASVGGSAKKVIFGFEPDAQTILNELIPYYLEIKLFEALLNSFTSEQAARMVAMQNAKTNAAQIADAITLMYNKIRQERITNEILDISNTHFAS